MLETITSSSILRTKLYQPPITVDLVPRYEPLAWLDRYHCQPFILCSAPAGYGKTTLISSWIETLDGPTAWISLDEQDNDLVIFLTYVIAAIQNRFPAGCQATLALLKAPGPPSHAALLRCFSNDLDRLAQDLTLVLDDYHHLHEMAIHNLLSELLRHPPRPLHLVVITRRDPPLALARLRACDQMTEIRQQDLRFTVAETAVFLKQVTGSEVDAKVAAVLTERTEGWVTGLRLAALAIRQQGNLDLLSQDMPENVPFITEYLVTEVLSQQPPDIQNFLLQTSILNRLHAPLCDAVRGQRTSVSNGLAAWGSDSLAILKQLYKANLFLIPLSQEPPWYRYHHVFQGFLQSQLRRRNSPDEIAALHARASCWLTDQGYIEEALRHTLLAGNASYDLQVVEAHPGGMTNHEEWQYLGELLRLTFSESVAGDAELRIQAGARPVAPGALPSAGSPLTADETLTTREIDILELLGRRLQTKEIAELLCIAPATVKTHLKHLFQKLGVSRRRQAVARGHALGLLDLPVKGNLNDPSA